MKKLIILLTLLIAGCSTTIATEEHQIDRIPQDQFSSVIVDFKETDKPIITPAPPQRVEPKAVVTKPKPTPKPVTRQGTTNSAILASGTASWYCKTGVSACTRNHPGGMYAAIRKDLLYLRGKSIKVCDSNNCITVTIIDCNCGPRANLIDLYSDAYRRLAPLSTGRIPVRIYK